MKGVRYRNTEQNFLKPLQNLYEEIFDKEISNTWDNIFHYSVESSKV